jgi:hypothetical protein
MCHLCIAAVDTGNFRQKYELLPGGSVIMALLGGVTGAARYRGSLSVQH